MLLLMLLMPWCLSEMLRQDAGPELRTTVTTITITAITTTITIANPSSVGMRIPVKCARNSVEFEGVGGGKRCSLLCRLLCKQLFKPHFCVEVSGRDTANGWRIGAGGRVYFGKMCRYFLNLARIGIVCGGGAVCRVVSSTTYDARAFERHHHHSHRRHSLHNGHHSRDVWLLRPLTPDCGAAECPYHFIIKFPEDYFRYHHHRQHGAVFISLNRWREEKRKKEASRLCKTVTGMKTAVEDSKRCNIAAMRKRLKTVR
ncbi:hypothetical protein E2C01_036735 [Portunus trituberculatus]|uniref:Uncharacterized protein n=1 Tax=Portunus trituberculatus TaxID=210409 RepID=A0A5B7FDG5_PORTR|nr:hypothetical protein [Portunus trituberculatus]